MTTISPSRRRASKSSRKKLFFILIAASLFFSVVTLARSPLQEAFWFLAGPLTEVRNTVAAATSIFFYGFSSHQSLSAQNTALRAELAAAHVALTDRNLLYAENSNLKTRLGRAELTGNTVVLAGIVSRPPAVPYDTLILDAGERQGVAAGDLVAAGGSVYIGVIAEVYAATSRVVLFSAPGETHEALLFTRVASSTPTSHPVSVVGQGGGSLRAEVPAGVEVSVGDEVVLQSILPELVAQVIHVEKKSGSSFQTIYLQLPVNLYSLRLVEVRKPVTTYDE